MPDMRNGSAPANADCERECARCGSCSVVCPVFRVTGREEFTARGRLHLLATPLARTPSAKFRDLFARCLLCGACESACSRGLPIRERMVAAREQFPPSLDIRAVRKGLAGMVLEQPLLLRGLVRAGYSLSRLRLLPPDSGLRLRLGLSPEEGNPAVPGMPAEDEERDAGADFIQYFPGCMARYLQPSIMAATDALSRELGGKPLHAPGEQVCCGLAAWSAGRLEAARKLARKNMAALEGTRGPILTSCASCAAHLRHYPVLFRNDSAWEEKAERFSARVVELTEFLHSRLPPGRLAVRETARVRYHEPCHLRFDPERSGQGVSVVERIRGAETVRPGENRCCGHGGLFHIGYPELSDRVFARAFELVSPDTDLVVTTCSGCLMQWQALLAVRGSPVRGVHLGVWLRECVGQGE